MRSCKLRWTYNPWGVGDDQLQICPHFHAPLTHPSSFLACSKILAFWLGPLQSTEETKKATKDTYLKLFMQALLYFHLHTQGLGNLNTPGKICKCNNIKLCGSIAEFYEITQSGHDIDQHTMGA